MVHVFPKHNIKCPRERWKPVLQQVYFSQTSGDRKSEKEKKVLKADWKLKIKHIQNVGLSCSPAHKNAMYLKTQAKQMEHAIVDTAAVVHLGPFIEKKPHFSVSLWSGP